MVKRTNPRESAIESRLREGVESLGGLCVKFKDPARRGAPDRLVLMSYCSVYFVELKRPRGGVLGKHQKRYHRDLCALGFPVRVLWTEADVDIFLKDIN